MIVTYKLEMDLQRREMTPWVNVVQGDVNTRVLELILFSDGEIWKIPEGVSIRMGYCKNDGKKGVYDTLPDGSSAWSAQDNVVSVILAPQMLTTAGPVLAQVELIRGTDSLTTFPVQLLVEQDVAADTLGSEEYVNLLQWMEEELDALLRKAKESGEFTGPAGPQGTMGPTAYDYAVAGGFAGTEEEFTQLLVTPCLPLGGGTMQGQIDMGGQCLKSLGEPQEGDDAATKAYVDGRRVTGSVVFRAAAWSDTAPYTQTVGIPGVLAGDWIRLEPAYRMNLEQDLTIKAALDCISFVNGLRNQIQAFCLESRPQTDLTVYVEALR